MILQHFIKTVNQNKVTYQWEQVHVNQSTANHFDIFSSNILK